MALPRPVRRMPTGSIGPGRDHPLTVLMKMRTHQERQLRERLSTLRDNGPRSPAELVEVVELTDRLVPYFRPTFGLLRRAERVMAGEVRREQGDEDLTAADVGADTAPLVPEWLELERDTGPPDLVEQLVDALITAPAGPPRPTGAVDQPVTQRCSPA